MLLVKKKLFGHVKIDTTINIEYILVYFHYYSENFPIRT